MATKDGSEDFDLTGVNVSDGDDEDFDWASLDEQEQAAISHTPGHYAVKASAIPFADATTEQQKPASIAPGSSKVLQTASDAMSASTSQAQDTASPSPRQSSEPPASGLTSTPQKPHVLPNAVGDRPSTAQLGRVLPGQTGQGTPPAAAAVLSSPAEPSAQDSSMPADVAAGPPAPRYAVRTVNSTPQATDGPTAHSPAQPAAVQSPQPTAVPTSPITAASDTLLAPIEVQQPVAPMTSTPAAAADRPVDKPASQGELQAPAVTAAPGHEASKGAAAQAGTASSSSQHHVLAGGGWGWGLSGLSSKLQQVAIGAAKDLQELTVSVQQAVAEAVAAADVSEVDRLSAYQAHPSRAPAVSTVAPPAALAVSRDSQSQLPTIHEPLGGEEVGSPSAVDSGEQRRLDVLQKLQGRDTQLEAGLKVIDDQVDLLAAGAAKALGSLWGGFSNVAKTGWTVGQALTTRVEAAAKEVAKELSVGLEEGAQVVAPVTSLAERLAAQAEKGLESVGRAGASLLEPQFNSRGGSSNHHHHHMPSDWAATFDSCFELYGGSQAAEELEQLSSDCAGICNRARAKLQQVHREQIDATLSKLVPAFELGKQRAQTAADSSSSTDIAQSHQPGEVSDVMQEGLEQLYLPVSALCNKGKHKIEQLQEEAKEAAADAAAEDGASAAADQQAGQAEVTTADAPDEGQHQATEASQEQGGFSSKVEALLSQLLSGLRSTAVKSLAEVSAGQLMVLLALGRSVAAVPRYGKPLDDGLEWPAEPEAVAAIMRQQVQRMMADIQQLAGGFKATAPQLLSLLQAACSRATGAGYVELTSEGAQQQASLVAEEVAADCNTAVRHLTDGFGKLLYVVLLSSLHRAGDPARPDDPAEAVN